MKAMRTPKDQGLFFTVFLGLALPAVFLFWICIPAVSPHLHQEEDGEPRALKPGTREEAIYQAEFVLKQAGEKLTALEAEAEEKRKEEGKEGKKK